MLKKLQICQNKVVRFILNMEPRTSITQEILDKVKMLKVPDRVSQLRLNHVFNIANDLAQKNLSQNFTFNQGRTRSATNRNFIIQSRSKCSNNSFVYSAIKDWNILPANIKECTSKSSFKTHSERSFKGWGQGQGNRYFYIYITSMWRHMWCICDMYIPVDILLLLLVITVHVTVLI